MTPEGGPLCNMCGLTTHLPVGPAGSGETAAHGLIDASVEGGYASTPGNGHGALDDGHHYTFSLCEFCLDWLFTLFKMPPVISDYMHEGAVKVWPELNAMGMRGPPPKPPTADELLWRTARQRVNEDEWRKFKKEFFDEANRRALARGHI